MGRAISKCEENRWVELPVELVLQALEVGYSGTGAELAYRNAWIITAG